MKISFQATQQLIKFFSLVMILIISFFRPVLKYFEYVHGGIRVNISAVLLIFLSVSICIAIIYLIYKNKVKINDRIIFVLLILLFINILQAIQLPFLFKDYDTNSIIKTLPDAIIHPWVFLLIGFYIQKIIANNRYDKLIKILWGIYSLIIFFYSITNSSFAILTKGAQIYLMLADSYALLSFLLIVKLDRRRIIYIIISAVLLFTLLSRTSFFLFLFSFIIFYLIYYPKQTIFVLTISVIAIGIFIVTLNYTVSDRKLQEHRMLRLLTKNEDHSRLKRVELLNEGIESIKENVLFGDFMGDIKEKNRTGNYIHNILSYWRQYGIFVFLGIIVLTLLNYFTISRLFLNKRKRTRYVGFLFLYSTFFIAEIIIARSYLCAYIWLIFSAVPVYLLSDENKENNNEILKCDK